jgi:DNA replication protein DnaC
MCRSGRLPSIRRSVRSSPAWAGHDARQRILARRQYPPQPGRLEDAARARGARRHTTPHREQGEIDDIEAIDDLLAEELSLRENRRVRAALRMARLPILKTLAGFDFSFQPSLDRNRIMALAGLDFINRAEVIHLLGPTDRAS